VKKNERSVVWVIKVPVFNSWDIINDAAATFDLSVISQQVQQAQNIINTHLFS